VRAPLHTPSFFLVDAAACRAERPCVYHLDGASVTTRREGALMERADLERRVADLEKEVSALKAGGLGPRPGIRKRASWGIGDIPFYDIAVGPDLERGERRGHAKGVIAIGDIATGVFAVGGLSRGVFAFGGLAAGLVSFGGLSVGLLGAIGGLAIGGLALGGGAIGGVAIGGGAIGYSYACGGGAVGPHVVDATHRDPEAEEFFREHGLARLCQSR
jgi:hypothetical protein